MSFSFVPKLPPILRPKPERVNRRFRRSPIPEGPYINTIIRVIHPNGSITHGPLEDVPFPNEKEVYERIKFDKEHISKVFSHCGKNLTIRHVWDRNHFFPAGTRENPLRAETIDPTKPIDENDEIGARLIKIREDAVKIFPEINLVICYTLGDTFGTNMDPESIVEGVTYDDNDNNPCYLILLSEKATPDLVAHEIGHMLNYSNINGRKNDPDPYPGNEAHNKNQDNLMYPSVTSSTITEAQCKQFFESKIILNNTL